MANPQPFLSHVTRDEVHLQYQFKHNMDEKLFLKALGKLWESKITGINDPTLNDHHESAGGSSIAVVGFKPEFWRQLTKGDLPDNLNSFAQDLEGINGKVMPAAQLDFWLWFSQANPSALFDSLYEINKLLRPFVDLVSQTTCFQYYNGVTFDGFADGIANPNPFRAIDLTVIPDSEKGAGGTTVLLQKYSMQVEALRGLPVHCAEAVYGRTKAGGHQLSPMPDDSHVNRSKVYRHGEEIDIVRRNANYTETDSSGIMFVGISKDISVPMEMLKQMIGIGLDGVKKTDKLLDFSTAISSAIYFVPSIEALMSVGVLPQDAA